MNDENTDNDCRRLPHSTNDGYIAALCLRHLYSA